MRLLVIIIIIVSFFSRAYCQETESDSVRIYSLREVIVTATRTAKPLAEVGKNVSRVKADQIDGSSYHDLSDVLTQQEGITVVGTGQNYGVNQNIFLRGANSNQTVIMIDNVRMTDPSSVNDAPDLSELSLTDIDHIEIVRGLNSTLYGSSSIGGVVNLLSRKQQKIGLNIQTAVEGGTFGSKTSFLREHIFLNYTVSSGAYANGEFNNINVRGLDATVDTVTNPAVYNRRDRDNFRHRDYVGKIGFINDSWDIYGAVRRMEQKKDLDKRAFVDDDNYTLDYFRNLYSYGIAYIISSAMQLKARGGYSNMHRTAVDDSSIIDAAGTTDHSFGKDQYRGNTSTNEIQLSIRYPHWETVFGGNYYHESMSLRSYYYSWSQYGVYEYLSDLGNLNLHTSTSSVFARAEISGGLLNDRWNDFTLAIGSNALHHSEFGSHFVYEINPSVKLSSSALMYLSYATGFTSPSLYQLYAPARDAVSGITRGNIHLQPERSQSFELGVKQSLSNSLEYTISFFHTSVDDMIEYVYLWDKNIGLDTIGNNWMRNDYRGDTYLNLGTQTTQGIDASITSKMNDCVTIGAVINLVDGRLDYDPSSIDTSVTHGHHVQINNNGTFLTKHSESIGLVRRPSTAVLNITYVPVQRLSLRMDMRYVGKRGDVYYDSNLGPYGALGTVPLPDYMLVNLSAKITVGEFLIGVRVENAFNTKYGEIKGFTTRGRGVYAEVRYSLQ